MQSALDEEHVLTLKLLKNLVSVCQATGKLDEAIKYGRQLMNASQKKGEAGLGYLLESLDTLAALFSEEGAHEEEVVCLTGAIEIVTKVRPGDDLGLSHLLDRLGLAYLILGEYRAALAPARRSFEIKRKTLPPGDPDLVDSLIYLSRAYQENGDSGEAERLLHEALDSWQGDRNSATVTRAMNNLATVFFERGDFHLAVPLLSKLADLERDASEPDTEEAKRLNNLGFAYMEMGDFAQARYLLEEALLISASACRKMSSAYTNSLYASCLHNRATLHMQEGDTTSCAKLLTTVIRVRKEVLGEEHPDYAAALGSMGITLLARLQFDEAETYLLEYRNAALRAGDEHPMYAGSLHNLGLLYAIIGKYSDAIPLVQQALQIRSKTLGDSHPDVLESISSLAWMEAAAGHMDEVVALLHVLVGHSPSHLSKVLSSASDRQRLAYMSSQQRNTDLLVTLVCHHCQENRAAKGLLFDLLMQRKAIVAEATRLQLLRLAANRDSELSYLHEALVSKRLRLKQLHSPSGEGPSAEKQAVEQLEQECESLEQRLAGSLHTHDFERFVLAANRQTVVRSLPNDSALIEIVRYTHMDVVRLLSKGIPCVERYVALLITSSDPDGVNLVDLGEAHEIDRLLADYRTAVTGQLRAGEDETAPAAQQVDRDVTIHSETAILREAIGAAVRDVGTLIDEDSARAAHVAGLRLRQAVLDPLLPFIDGQKHIIIAPDGNLNLLPWQALPMGDDLFVIDHYQISYVSAGRDVMRFGAPRSQQPGSSLVVAYPDYDLAGSTVQGFRSNYPFRRLGGMRREGEEVGSLLAVGVIMNENAMEDIVKRCHSPQVLHIATHGFFFPNGWDGNCSAGVTLPFTGASINTGQLGFFSLPSPFARSALAFAGANTRLQQGRLPREADDGLLTAEDVAVVDLAATDLVVLSACESGVGDIQVGEGVFGLRRAFVLNGAKRLIMSLWKVHDDQTRELMVMMYENVIQKQVSFMEALQNAQLEMRRKYPDHPYYWGAFIYQGDPEPFELVSREMG